MGFATFPIQRGIVRAIPVSDKNEGLMLRITVNDSTPHAVGLLLEGQIIEGWVDVLANYCEGILNQQRGLTLDLAGVSFLDKRGIALLQYLIQRRVKVINCSGFVGQLLETKPSAP
jgi:ABC-type transporter Mla MlaB component